MTEDVTGGLSAWTQYGQGGLVIAMLVSALVAVLRGHWVPGAYFRAMKQERDEALAVVKDLSRAHERLTAGWKPPTP